MRNNKDDDRRFGNMMRRLVIAFMITALVLTGVAPSFAAETQKDGGGVSGKNSKLVDSADISWDDAPTVAGTSVIMIDAGSGNILYEKNAYEKRDPASITKIMTCLVVLETMDLDQEVTITKDSSQTGMNISLKKGEVMTVEQLLYAMMLPSANDAAEELAIACGGTVENFSEMMNERAKRCGAEDTNFTNPNGLNTYGQENHRTTAYDIAMISKAAMKNPDFRKIVSSTKYTIPATNMSPERNIKSTNPCLYSKEKTVEIDGEKIPIKYSGATGIKTGTTSVAGYCYCGSAKKDGTELIVVTLNSEEYGRFADAIKLWNYGFSKYYTYNAVKSKSAVDQLSVRRGAESTVSVGIEEDIDLTLNKDYDSDDITIETEYKDKKITAPVKKGQNVGTLTVYNDKHKAIASAQLLALKDVEKGGPLSYVGIADEDIPFFIISLAAAIIILIAIRIIYVKTKKKKKQRRRAQRQRSVRRREWEKEKNPFDDNL